MPTEAQEPIPAGPPPRVFVSYVHENAQHRDNVLCFTQLLRQLGVDARLDQFVEHTTIDWPKWMHDEISNADIVLCVASASYKERTEGGIEPGDGRGARWEGAILRQWIYSGLKDAGRRVLGVVLPGGSAEDLPFFLFPIATSHYKVASLDLMGLEGLLRRLTDQPSVLPDAIGAVPSLPIRRGPMQLTVEDFEPPVSVSLEALLGVERGAWSPAFWASTVPDLSSPLGVDARGQAVVVDLVTQGPNLALAGSVGSGKTETISTLMLGLAIRNPPTHLAMITIDSKGSNFSFHPLMHLPHIQDEYSPDMEEFESVPALLKREMAMRRSLLVKRHCDDLGELWAKYPHDDPPPYLLVVVEDWGSLSYDKPDVVEAVLSVARFGRAAGIQVVVGSQQAETLGTFPAHLRVAFRMYDDREALDFAHMPISVPHIPGRAVLIVAGEQRPFQVADNSREAVRSLVETLREAWLSS
jgi:FtsK/SpoIIIE family/SEFIR domain